MFNAKNMAAVAKIGNTIFSNGAIMNAGYSTVASPNEITI